MSSSSPLDEKRLFAEYSQYAYIHPADPLGAAIIRASGDMNAEVFDKLTEKVSQIFLEEYDTEVIDPKNVGTKDDLEFHEILEEIGFTCPPGWPSGMAIRVECVPFHFKHPSGEIKARWLFITPCEDISKQVIYRIKTLENEFDCLIDVYVLVTGMRAKE